MTQRTVKDQQQLDQAITDQVDRIIINSPEGVWLTVSEGRIEQVTGSSCVRVTGSASVDWVTGSASVDWVTGSASVDWVTGSASVGRVDGSARVGRVDGSARVVKATQTAAIHLHGGKLQQAAPTVAVFVHTADSTWTGGTLIDLRQLNLKDPAIWCEYHGVQVTDGVATVYKAVDGEWTTGYGFDYSPGATPSALDWRDNNRCGGGLHFSPSPQEARSYHPSATRFVAVGIELATLRPILGDTPKCKAPAVVVACREVTIDGEPVTVEAVAK